MLLDIKTFLTCLLFSLLLSIQETLAQKPPNVILILADDLGYGDLSCYGQQNWSTPHLDQLAKDGVRFTQFYTPMAYCAPTRASLLTGRYPYKHGLTSNPFPTGGVRTNFQTFRGSDSLGLDPKEVLLSEVLKEKGYVTKAIGKWHLGHKPQFLPTRNGFDEYLGIPYSNDMKPVKLLRNEETVEYPIIQANLTKHYTQEALDFIEKSKAKPFFLYLPHAMPHKPLAVSEEFYTPSTKKDLYADVMRELDASIGQILKKLKQEGLEENTIVIFTSDNGPWFGGSTGGLRGMKATNWEGGIKVPFLIQWKGHISSNINANTIAGTIDVFPTLLKLLAIEIPKNLDIDGKDLSPVFQLDAKQTKSGKQVHEVLFSFHGTKLQTVRSGSYKLHLLNPERTPPLPSDSNWVDPVWPDGVTIIAQSEQPKANQHPGLKTGDSFEDVLLFDLDKDPSEQKNVAKEHPEWVKKLKQYADRLSK